MIVVDAHEDIAYNAICFNRDYRRNAWQKRRLETDSELRQRAGSATLGLPDAILGRVAIVFATLFVSPATREQVYCEQVVYHDEREANRLASQQLDHYHWLADESERIRLILNQADLDATLATWADDKSITEHQQGLVILMEGADPIIEPKQFEAWYGRGVRIVGPAWSGTRYAGGTGMPGPLTTLGHELLEVMASSNALLDLSHIAERAFLEAVDSYEGAIIASHSNPRHFCNTDRHLSDEMIRRLAERDGVMGVVLYNRFLSNTWATSDPKQLVPFSVVLDVVDYICQITGSAAHVGIGSDFDGGFGAESIPDGMDTVADLWDIGAGLRARSYQEADIEAILGGNMLRKLRQALPSSQD